MPGNVPALKLPVRGVPGGRRDWWDDPDDTAELRSQAMDAEKPEAAATNATAAPALLAARIHDFVLRHLLTGLRTFG